MAYTKYIKKGGKIYGPYIYHSRRIDGKVISEYHGPKKFNYKIFIFALLSVFIVALFIFAFSSSEREITGKAVLDLNVNYQEGESLEGKITISLQEGELIPSSSKLVFENNGNFFEYDLNNLVDEETVSGDFHVTGTSFSGSGEGYGIPGENTIYPEVHFTLSILSEEKQEEVIEEETTQNETVEESNGTEGVISGITAGISNFFLGLGPTGNVIIEFENEVEGEVSFGDIFTYILQEGQRAEIKPRSVIAGSKQLSDNAIEFEIQGNEVLITTNYFETEEGFGQDYLGGGSKELIIDVSDLNLIFQQGNLKLSIVDSGVNIVSLETVLGDGGTVEAETTPRETFVQEPQLPTSETIEIIQEEPSVTQEILELTEQERAVLAQEFGNVSVEVKEANLIGEFIIIRYELGDYWVEHSYSSDLDNETLSRFRERDMIKFLKDIAKSISEEEQPEQEIKEFVENISF